MPALDRDSLRAALTLIRRCRTVGYDRVHIDAGTNRITLTAPDIDGDITTVVAGSSLGGGRWTVPGIELVRRTREPGGPVTLDGPPVGPAHTRPDAGSLVAVVAGHDLAAAAKVALLAADGKAVTVPLLRCFASARLTIGRDAATFHTTNRFVAAEVTVPASCDAEIDAATVVLPQRTMFALTSLTGPAQIFRDSQVWRFVTRSTTVTLSDPDEDYPDLDLATWQVAPAASGLTRLRPATADRVRVDVDGNTVLIDPDILTLVARIVGSRTTRVSVSRLPAGEDPVRFEPVTQPGVTRTAWVMPRPA